MFDYNISLNNENVNIKIENDKNKIAISDNSEIQIEKIDFINGNKTLKPVSYTHLDVYKRQLFKYCKFYSGKEPEFVEGDVFRIIVPLDEEYSFDFGVNNKSVSETLDDKIATLESDLKRTKNKIETLDCDFETKEELEIVQLIKENPSITQKEIQQRTGISLGTVKRILPKLQKKGILVREGGKRFGRWIIK